MRSSWNIGLFLFNAIMIPATGTFGPPTPVWIAIIQIVALILTAVAMAGDAYSAGQEEGENQRSDALDTERRDGYNRGYSAGYKAANEEVRKAVDGWFNV